MFRKLIESIIGGAMGLAALYAVAKVAYAAGHDMAEAERKYDELCASGSVGSEPAAEQHEAESKICIAKPTRKRNRLGLLFGLKKFLGKGNRSVITDLVSEPEEHQLEAYIKEGEIHVDIRKRRSLRGEQTLTPEMA